MLKKCLLGLFVLLVGFIGYGFCDTVNVFGPRLFQQQVSSNTNYHFYTGDCITYRRTECTTIGQIYNISNELVFQYSNDTQDSMFCFDFEGYYRNTYSNYCIISVTTGFKQNCPVCQECEECQQCPEINTGDILSGSCDINYCVENDLCPTSTGSRSELVINDIVHEGKPLINVSIPDDIYWDYSTDDNQFDLYVGSGYNQEYIDSILAINSYRPDNEDFTNIFVSGLTLIFPYIFVALLIVFMWKLLKRIFK